MPRTAKSGEFAQISMRFPVDIKNRLAIAADHDHRTMTELVVAITACWLDNTLYRPISRPARPGKPKPAPKQRFKRRPGRVPAASPNPYASEVLARFETIRDPSRDVWTLEDIAVAAFNAPLSSMAVNFDVAIRKTLLVMGWRECFDTHNDDALVWLPPAPRI